MKPSAPADLCCPSAQPDTEASVTIGVVNGTLDEPKVTYFGRPQSVSEPLLRLAGPVNPTEVFRFAAPCACNACRHFNGADCRLAARIVKLLPPVVSELPQCGLRPHCRWWAQEGRAACLRCPQIVTESYTASQTLRVVSDPATAI
jgi:hypothetical protein